MVTHYPRHAPSPSLSTVDAPRAGAGVGTRVLEWIRHAYCGLHGHDAMLHFEKDRMLLQCVSCGHRTPGWELNVNDMPRPAAQEAMLREETRHRAVIRPHLISARRIA